MTRLSMFAGFCDMDAVSGYAGMRLESMVDALP